MIHHLTYTSHKISKFVNHLTYYIWSPKTYQELYELGWEIRHATFIGSHCFQIHSENQYVSNQTMLQNVCCAQVWLLIGQWWDNKRTHKDFLFYQSWKSLQSQTLSEIDVTLAVGKPELNILLESQQSTHTQICPALFDMSVIRQSDQPSKITYSSCYMHIVDCWSSGLRRRQTWRQSV